MIYGFEPFSGPMHLGPKNTGHVECKNKGDTSIIGATRTISKSFRKYMSKIPGKHEVKELQQTAILGTAHILRKVLM